MTAGSQTGTCIFNPSFKCLNSSCRTQVPTTSSQKQTVGAWQPNTKDNTFHHVQAGRTLRFHNNPMADARWGGWVDRPSTNEQETTPQRKEQHNTTDVLTPGRQPAQVQAPSGAWSQGVWHPQKVTTGGAHPTGKRGKVLGPQPRQNTNNIATKHKQRPEPITRSRNTP